MLPRRIPAALAALLLAACAMTPRGEPLPPDPADARAADDAALEAAAAEIAALEDHWVLVAGGTFLGGAWSLPDAAALAEGLAGTPEHGYLFVPGTGGDRRVSLPALWAPRVAGNGLLAALGLAARVDPVEGTLVLSRGERTRTFRTEGGAVAAAFLLEPVIGAGDPVPVALVVSTGFGGTAVVTAADAARAGLARSEIPGTALLAEAMTGRTVPCRRAHARVSLAGWDDEPEARPSAIVEVLFPR
jgi:hypothetical protein